MSEQTNEPTSTKMPAAATRRRFSTSPEEARDIPGVILTPSKYSPEMLLEDEPASSCMKIKTADESLSLARGRPSVLGRIARPGSNHTSRFAKGRGSGRSFGSVSRGSGRSFGSRSSGRLSKLGQSLRSIMGLSVASSLDEFDNGVEEFSGETKPLEEEEDLSPKVRFDTISIRLYDVIPDDNPSASGKGPAVAIALSWTFVPQDDIALDNYESTRKPRRRMDELKITMADRQRRLLEHGASREEIQEYAKRAHKAKIRRQKAVQAFGIHGPGYLKKMERQERVTRFFRRLFGMRKTYEQEHADLWKAAAAAQKAKGVDQTKEAQQPERALAGVETKA